MPDEVAAGRRSYDPSFFDPRSEREVVLVQQKDITHILEALTGIEQKVSGIAGLESRVARIETVGKVATVIAAPMVAVIGWVAVPLLVHAFGGK